MSALAIGPGLWAFVYETVQCVVEGGGYPKEVIAVIDFSLIGTFAGKPR